MSRDYVKKKNHNTGCAEQIPGITRVFTGSSAFPASRWTSALLPRLSLTMPTWSYQSQWTRTSQSAQGNSGALTGHDMSDVMQLERSAKQVGYIAHERHNVSRDSISGRTLEIGECDDIKYWFAIYKIK